MRWEMSTLEKHKGKPVIVMRIVKVLKELAAAPDRLQDIPLPVEGGLLCRRSDVVWTVDLTSFPSVSPLQPLLPNLDEASSKKSRKKVKGEPCRMSFSPSTDVSFSEQSVAAQLPSD